MHLPSRVPVSQVRKTRKRGTQMKNQVIGSQQLRHLVAELNALAIPTGSRHDYNQSMIGSNRGRTESPLAD